MASQFDESDFIDRDYQPTKGSGAAGEAATPRPNLSRSEIEAKVTEAQKKLADLKQAQQELERERAALEDARRRRIELETGREEMGQHLTRGIALLEEAEFKARREAEQMAKNLVDLRDVLAKVNAIREETWTPDSWQAELTRALTAIENSRMEWNRSLLKWPFLNPSASPGGEKSAGKPEEVPWAKLPWLDLCKAGLAMTWPLVVVALLALLLLALKN